MVPITISKTNRRFVLFECMGRRKPKEYYNKLVALKSDESALYSYYKFLMSINISGYDFKDFPKTDFYKRVKRSAKKTSGSSFRPQS